MTPHPRPIRRPRFVAPPVAAARLAILLALVMAGIAPALPAGAQVPRQDFWVANSFVTSVALSGNTLYIGGDFTMVGPATGCYVTTDATTGAVLPGFPQVNGTIYDMASDGAGGWFIGGIFTR